jgi:hypothetical protein
MRGPDDDRPRGHFGAYSRLHPRNLLIDHWGDDESGGIGVDIDDNPLAKYNEPGRVCDGVARCNDCNLPVRTLICTGAKITHKRRDRPLYDVSDYNPIAHTMEMEIFDGGDSDEEVTTRNGPVVAFPRSGLINLPRAKDIVRCGAGYVAAVAAQLPVADAAKTMVDAPDADPIMLFLVIIGIAIIAYAMGAWNKTTPARMSPGNGR